jgi:hypothetical protein
MVEPTLSDGSWTIGLHGWFSSGWRLALRRTVKAPRREAGGSQGQRVQENYPCFCPGQGIHTPKKLSDIVDGRVEVAEAEWAR